MYSIQAKWEEFETRCLKGVSPQQHREAKVSFYAGVVSILKAQDQAAQSHPNEEEKLKIIEAWMSELYAFEEAYLRHSGVHH